MKQRLEYEREDISLLLLTFHPIVIRFVERATDHIS